MFKRYMKLALKGLWYVVQGAVNYMKIFIKMLIMIPGILLYVSLYEGEVVINMTTEAFLTSPLFGIILILSFAISFLFFVDRCEELDTMVLGTSKVLGKKLTCELLWALNDKRRFNADESVNFLRTMKKFGFFMVVDLNSPLSKIERTTSYLKAALSLRGVDLSQFTKEDFNEIGEFLSPNCIEDTISIDEKKLKIMNDAFPLMEILRKEVENMSNEVPEENNHDTSLKEATTLLQNYHEDKKASMPLIIVAEQDVIVALRKEYATILDTFALVDKVELFQKSRAFGMKPFEICTEAEFEILDPRIVDCSCVVKLTKESTCL
ncbi:hypothetical protein [Sulfurospirillum multivorans]|uniref:Uncharacterized protein n=2 Tax=Sulfurospirillum multivorans TaxID=66821 RepID=A0AA86ALR4_SULMK|nr:hypothetical protein [Sulfurospirillum multivorans]AHJ13026.1 hypothetical protein SMUL_1771 [Sulfurospirillum multivorans DSM 12446]QEH06517.1 hypothetical protein SMN_1752 [Sulfurospirillum multivorans]